MTGVLTFKQVSFTHLGSTTALFEKIDFSCLRGWSGIVGANGGGKTTLLNLALGTLLPDSGAILRPPTAALCPQRCDVLTPELLEFFSSIEAKACVYRGLLAVGEDWGQRWDTLSYGERKRAQVAQVLSLEPDILALDEPTNHLDQEARDLLLKALRRYRGIGLLVSHDRAFLDDLCTQCLFVDSPDVIARPGNYSQGAELQDTESRSLERQREILGKERKRIERELRRRHEDASRTRSRMSGRFIDPKDNDTRAKINLARFTGKDACAHNFAAQLEKRALRVKHAHEELAVKPQYAIGVELSGCRSHRQVLIEQEPLQIHIGADWQIELPRISIGNGDRICITGPNGAGKSTTIFNLKEKLMSRGIPLLYIGQEITEAEKEAMLKELFDLSSRDRGAVLSFVSCLGTRPERILESTDPSPGELRKLALGLGLFKQPHLLILDEPTNHLDLPAIMALEEALTHVQCALLIVSHDRKFLEKTTTLEWKVRREGERSVLSMH